MNDSKTVIRYAVIVRDSNGRGELLGQIHTTEAVARANAAYWRSHYTGAPVTAEVVQFEVPVQGQAVAGTRDELPPLWQEPQFEPSAIESALNKSV